VNHDGVNQDFDPHGRAKVYRSGVPLESASGVVILLHGRGGSAEDILALADALDGERLKLAFLAPEATASSWYPNSFLAERSMNEPWISSALGKVQSVVDLALRGGVARERIVIGGFSQGACLATEFVATHPARYGGLIAWTGGLIGPLGSDVAYAGELAGMPVFQGSGDPDPYIPWARVEESARVLTAMGARVTTRRYPGKPHSVSAEEIELARQLLEGIFGDRGGLTPTKTI
jgi:phospholipase/carboxylesterase